MFSVTPVLTPISLLCLCHLKRGNSQLREWEESINQHISKGKENNDCEFGVLRWTVHSLNAVSFTYTQRVGAQLVFVEWLFWKRGKALESIMTHVCLKEFSWSI